MDIVIVRKFRHCKEVHPILLLVAHGTPKVLFEDLVDSFGLSRFSLTMICVGDEAVSVEVQTSFLMEKNLCMNKARCAEMESERDRHKKRYVYSK